MLQKLDFPDAQVYLQGAHLTRFKDWLFLSSRSHFEEGRAIRGGIPIVFPWFGSNKEDANAPQHGWARTAEWEIFSRSESEVALRLERDEWEIELSYDFGDQLEATFWVRNKAEQARTFECALHTYFAVSNIAQVEIEGLDGREFIAKSRGNVREVQRGPIRFAGEVDWVFPKAHGPVSIRDGATGYELRGTWKSAVVWNPWNEKAAAMSDLGQDEWRRFVCVEVGAIAEDAVELSAGGMWVMSLEISRL